MDDVNLTLACWDYDRTRALINGDVTASGINLDIKVLPPLQSFSRMLEQREFQVSELSLASFHQERWWTDEEYFTRRHDISLLPGAWEVAAAARFRCPVLPERAYYGRADRTPYEKIRVPTLYIAGAQDRLIEPGWERVAERTTTGSSLVFEDCAHCPNIERAADFNEAVLDFLLAKSPPQSSSKAA